MSDQYTEVSTPSGGLGLWGYVDYGEAIAELRRHYEHEAALACAVLDELDNGYVRVWHQLGPWAARNRREVAA